MSFEKVYLLAAHNRITEANDSHTGVGCSTWLSSIVARIFLVRNLVEYHLSVYTQEKYS